MAKIKVFNLIGENCISMENGQKLYSYVFPELKAGRPVELDFSGCKVFVSLFFNFSIGHLLKDFSPETLKSLVTISNLDAEGARTLKDVIDNAKRYYSMDDDTRKKIDEAILLENIND